MSEMQFGRAAFVGATDFAEATTTALKQEVLATLEPLFERAAREGLWFYLSEVHTDPVWMRPDDLRHENRNGRCIWSAINLTLLHPSIRTHELTQAVRDAEAALTLHRGHMRAVGRDPA